MTTAATRDLSEENLNQLIDLVYQTLEDDSAWQPFFKLCCETVGAKMIHMVAHDKTNGTISYSNGINMPVAGELAMLQKYQYLDPALAYFEQMKLLEWFNDQEVLSTDIFENHQYYQEFLLPYDTKYRHFTKVLENNQATIIFAMLTSPSQGPLPPEALRFLDKLLPHISRVCRLSIQNFIYSTQALVGHALVNKLRQPVILASVTGEIVHINDAGHELLAATDLISVKDGFLQIPPQYSQTFYDECAAMEYTLKSTQETQPSPFKLLHMQKPNQEESLYTFYSLLLPQRMMGAFGLRPLVMMFFYHPESAPQIDASILTAAFDLTPAECKIAILLAEGLSQKEIAHKLGIQPDTVRKQLQVIYQKTDTKQQTDLVRLMLNVPSNFVQEPRNRLNWK